MMVWVFFEDGEAPRGGPTGGFAGRDRAVNRNVLAGGHREVLTRKGHQNAHIASVHPVINFAIDDSGLLFTDQLAGRRNLGFLLLLEPQKIRVRWHRSNY